MTSDLTKRIEALDYKLRKVEGVERTKSFNAVLDLSLLVLELSRKVDRQDEE